MATMPNGMTTGSGDVQEFEEDDRLITPEECEAAGGHVFEMAGPPPWKCTFCDYAPEQK